MTSKTFFVVKSIKDTFILYKALIPFLFFPDRIKPNKTQKHLLILAWAFPPEVTGGVYRPLSLANGAIKRGWRVTLICREAPDGSNAAGNYLKNQIDNGIEIIRIKESSLRPSYKLFFPRISGGFINIFETINSIYEKLKIDQPSVIFASGPPFHNFVVAKQLGAILKKPYIIDYRDEWTECPFDFVDKGNVDYFFEKSCIESACKIIFTTKSHRTHQSKIFDIKDNEKMVVIPNGWDINNTPTSDVKNPLIKSEIQLAYLGYLGEHSLPSKFLFAMQDCIDASPELLSKIRLSFIGGKKEIALSQLKKFKYQNKLELIDQVPKPVALKIMQDVAGLILINEPRMDRYLPGKLYDYIAMRTPILVYGAGGEIESVINELGVGYVVNNETPSELAEILLNFNKLKINCHSLKTNEWLDKHSRSNLSNKLMDTIESAEDEYTHEL